MLADMFGELLAQNFERPFNEFHFRLGLLYVIIPHGFFEPARRLSILIGPSHTALHVVECFQLTEGGKTLQVAIRVEDPGAFTMPWSAPGQCD
jgi:hypothetical protein